MTTLFPPAASDAAPARVIYLDPTAPDDGDGSLATPYNAWGSFPVLPGDTILQRGGTETAGFAITAQGTADQPITIGSYGTGRAIVNGSVALSGARYVTVENLDIRGGEGIGVMVVDGSQFCTVCTSAVHAGQAGVLVQGAAALSIAIEDCDIYDNDYAGIWFDGAIAAAGQESRVSGNAIWRNGQQGILLNGSWVVVDANTVVNNGLSGLPGLSGIHVLGDSASDPAGHHNTITGNTVAWQRDTSSVDGNGIMLDHWSGDTLVSGNLVFGNDGCGINLLSSSNNEVRDNTVHDNMLDSGGTHVVSRAEIFLGETSVAPGLATGNTITGNTAAANSAYGVAIQVDEAAVAHASNTITANFISQAGTGQLWLWNGQGGTDLAGWNALPRTGSDALRTNPVAAAPNFNPAMLDRGFTPHSSLLLTQGGTAQSLVVAYGSAKDIIGSAIGSWMAGDGRDNILTAAGGVNLMSAGTGNAVLLGGPGYDQLFGGLGDTLLIAGSGNTLMVGGAGRSRLVGGAGDDVLYAGNGTGDKLLDGGDGQNLMIGGNGADTFVISGVLDVLRGFTRGQDVLDVSRLGVADINGLLLAGDETGGVIIDGTGTARALLVGTDVRTLTASDFRFAAPAATTTVTLDATAPAQHEGTDFVFTVTRSGDLSRADSIAWQVTGSGAAPADAADFPGGVLPAGRATFVAGEASRTVTVRVAADSLVEADEGFTLSLGGAYAGLGLGNASAGATILDDSLHCFAPGTRIATPFGPRAVETLGPGAAVLTDDGAAHILSWAGSWATDPADPAHRPVRIRAHAFGPGRPARDLLVSPSHALWLDGVMVPAIALLDGVRVQRDATPPARFHHVALPFHAAILAEGLAAETFCTCDEHRYATLPTVTGALPRLEGGAVLAALRHRHGLAPQPWSGQRDGFVERVLHRPGGIWVEGWASEPDRPACLTIVAGGTEMRAIANRWRIDLDRAGLPAAGFRAWIPGVHDANVRVLRAGDGTALPHLV